MARAKGFTKAISSEDAEKSRKWLVVDATGKTLGRLASEVAAIIRGKHKTTFTPYVDCGDTVVVLNAALVKTTGSKLEKKVYHQHTGFIGSVKSISLGDQLKKRPEAVIENAVWGMLPKGVLGKQSLRQRLKVVAGSDHPFAAQKPEKFEAKYI